MQQAKSYLYLLPHTKKIVITKAQHTNGHIKHCAKINSGVYGNAIVVPKLFEQKIIL
jgi:hypothetical protein